MVNWTVGFQLSGVAGLARVFRLLGEMVAERFGSWSCPLAGAECWYHWFYPIQCILVRPSVSARVAPDLSRCAGFRGGQLLEIQVVHHVYHHLHMSVECGTVLLDVFDRSLSFP